MWSSAFFVRVVLGLLSSLVVAAASIHVAGEDLPVNSTLDYPFTLTTRSPTGFHVVLNSDLRPVVTLDRRASTKFRLTNGNLTVLDSELTAIYGSTPIPFPPPLIPVVFTKNPRSGAILPFLAETNNREKGILTLTALGESEFFFTNNQRFVCRRDRHEKLKADSIFDRSCGPNSGRGAESHLCEARG